MGEIGVWNRNEKLGKRRDGNQKIFAGISIANYVWERNS